MSETEVDSPPRGMKQTEADSRLYLTFPLRTCPLIASYFPSAKQGRRYEVVFGKLLRIAACG
jgi:hypothetical protein